MPTLQQSHSQFFYDKNNKLALIVWYSTTVLDSTKADGHKQRHVQRTHDDGEADHKGEHPGHKHKNGERHATAKHNQHDDKLHKLVVEAERAGGKRGLHKLITELEHKEHTHKAGHSGHHHRHAKSQDHHHLNVERSHHHSGRKTHKHPESAEVTPPTPVNGDSATSLSARELEDFVEEFAREL